MADYVNIIDNCNLVNDPGLEPLALISQDHLHLEVDSVQFSEVILNKMGIQYSINSENIHVLCTRAENDLIIRRLILEGIRVFAAIPLPGEPQSSHFQIKAV